MGYFSTLNNPLLILALKAKIWLGHQLTAFSSKYRNPNDIFDYLLWNFCCPLTSYYSETSQ